MKKILSFLLILLAVQTVWAQNYKTVKEVSYTSKTDDYSAERLKLDVYYPKGTEDAPVVVWFHGGGPVSYTHLTLPTNDSV